jgi:hypothetical protein
VEAEAAIGVQDAEPVGPVVSVLHVTIAPLLLGVPAGVVAVQLLTGTPTQPVSVVEQIVV